MNTVAFTVIVTCLSVTSYVMAASFELVGPSRQVSVYLWTITVYNLP
jgi:hypothetical protein